MTCPLLIFDTHPIQYRAPVFRVLHEKLPGFKVGFFNTAFDGKKWWFQEVDKIPPQNFGLNLVEGYPHFFLNTSSLSLYQKFQALKETLNDYRPRAVMIYGYYQTEHWLLRLLTSQLNIPLIFVGETFDWRGSWFRKKIKRVLIRFFFRRVGEFIAIGKKTTQYYQNWGIASQKVTQAHYCTDLQPFHLMDDEAILVRKKVRESLNIPENAFVMLFVGRLFERKRPRDLIQIHQNLRRSHPVHTVFVGNGELQEELRFSTQSVEGIHWVGFKNQIELKKFYTASNLLVVPSEFETWGLVVNEAFSCGLPAVVTQTCGVADDLVVSGETGAVYPVGDVKAASSQILKLIEHPELCKQMSQKAKQTILTSYQPEQFALSIFSAFEKVISTKA